MAGIKYLTPKVAVLEIPPSSLSQADDTTVRLGILGSLMLYFAREIVARSDFETC